MRLTSPVQLDKVRLDFLAELAKFTKTVSVCGGTACQANDCRYVADAVKSELHKRNLSGTVRLIITGCHGLCRQGPIIQINPGEIFYPNVKPEMVSRIFDESVVLDGTVEEFLYVDLESGKRIRKASDIPFFKKQTRTLIGGNAWRDPSDIRDYIAHGGYTGLKKALFELTPQNIIDEITKSGLRGRGGGGFPTGRKWSSAAKAPGLHKWVIGNADEGNPGAFMDGSLLESNPHVVIEGMVIGAKAVGAQSGGGFIYVRNEYPFALASIEHAIRQARDWGFLGHNILGSGFDFDILINRGGGAFVCGESTALMASLEGKPGEPRAKYVHTVEQGYHMEPSVLNNVETWANVPRIINDGVEKYREGGSETSAGTKVLSLAGNVVNTGLVEIPMNRTLRELVFDICGGIPGGRKIKAVQAGGPSGGCIPESFLDLTVDFDTLDSAGAMLGAGGIIVMSEDVCMVDIPRHFVKFLESESCGKCTPCREGLKELDRLLTGIAGGSGSTDDIALIEEICEWMRDASLCALGKSAPNPVLSTLRYFRDEYMSHIVDHKCLAGVCKITDPR